MSNRTIAAMRNGHKAVNLRKLRRCERDVIGSIPDGGSGSGGSKPLAKLALEQPIVRSTAGQGACTGELVKYIQSVGYLPRGVLRCA